MCLCGCHLGGKNKVKNYILGVAKWCKVSYTSLKKRCLKLIHCRGKLASVAGEVVNLFQGVVRWKNKK